MRALIVTSLLLPLSAALPSTKCINECFAEPQLSMLAKSANLFGPKGRVQSPELIRQEMCNQTESVVRCLEDCEPSDQRAYFSAQLSKWAEFGCSGTEEEFKHRLDWLERELQCFNVHDEQLLVGIAGALFVKGGNPTRSEADNLCEITSTVGRFVGSAERCSPKAKEFALDLLEYSYRWVALKLGMEAAPEKCRDFQKFTEGEIGLDELFEPRNVEPRKKEDESTICMQACIQNWFGKMLLRAQHESTCELLRPIVQCFQDCPKNPLAFVADRAGTFLCSGPNAFVIQCVDNDEVVLPEREKAQRQIISQLLTSGANSNASVVENLCEVYSAIADPFIEPLKQFVDSTNNTELGYACDKTYRAFAAVASLPLRLTALKLGISQDDITCDEFQPQP